MVKLVQVRGPCVQGRRRVYFLAASMVSRSATWSTGKPRLKNISIWLVKVLGLVLLLKDIR